MSVISESKHAKILLKIFYAAIWILGAWLFTTYLLKCLTPFIIAILIAYFIEPVVLYLMKKGGIKRGFASFICTILTLVLLLGVLTLLIWRGAIEVSSLIRRLPSFLATLPSVASNIQTSVYRFIIAMPSEIQDYLFNFVEKTISGGIDIPSKLYEWLIGFVSDFASKVPSIILFFFTASISTYFISSSYPSIIRFIKRQIPENWHSRVTETKGRIKDTVLKWLSAQLILMGITFLILSTGLTIIGIEFSIILSGLIALVDALPIFGTGTVLIPWALISMLSGNVGQGAALGALYAVIILVRSFLEPKIVGHRIGLPPIATLMAMYIGFCSVGIWGMAVFPIALILIKQFNDQKYIKLWK